MFSWCGIVGSLTFALPAATIVEREVFDYSKVQWNRLEYALSDVNWDDIIQANDAEGFFSVEVTDINGRTVSVMKNFITGNEIKSIDLSSSENGVYFIKIYNSNVFKTYRMVKN